MQRFEYLDRIKALKVLCSNIVATLTVFNGVFLVFSMSKLRVFAEILLTFKKILYATRFVFLIYLISLVFFQGMAVIIAGDSASPVSYSFSIYKILDTLIKSNSFKDFTLDYKDIFIYLLFLPYFLFVEFTLLSLLLSIIYHTMIINFDKKKKKRLLRDKLTFPVFVELTLEHVKGVFMRFRIQSVSKNLKHVMSLKSSRPNSQSSRATPSR